MCNNDSLSISPSKSVSRMYSWWNLRDRNSGRERDRQKDTPSAVLSIKAIWVMTISCHLGKSIGITYTCPYRCTLFKICMEAKACSHHIILRRYLYIYIILRWWSLYPPFHSKWRKYIVFLPCILVINYN